MLIRLVLNRVPEVVNEAVSYVGETVLWTVKRTA